MAMLDIVSLRSLQPSDSEALWWNSSSNNTLHCSGDLSRPSCTLLQSELAKRNSIAVIRGIVSFLSLLGTFTIIVSVIVKKQTLSPKVHPIFMLSIADFMLAVLWATGGFLWLVNGSEQYDRDGCFAVLLTTVILECVTVNLTCVYAMLAYSSIRQRDFSNVYSLFEKDMNKHVWKPWKTILVYIFAWITPVILILVPFFSLDRRYGLIKYADECTCWCIPFFGNILPHANAMDPPTSEYLSRLSKFVLAYSLVIAVHYVFGFLLLFLVYWMVLARIRKMRTIHRERSSHHNLYGATEAIIIKGQSQAKTRVFTFLTVFLATGFFNVILSIMVVHYTATKLAGYGRRRPHVYTTFHTVPSYVMVAYILQSITIPLQGFLNAIIYGWTREDFVQAIRTSQNNAGIAVSPPNSKTPFYQQRTVRSTPSNFSEQSDVEEADELIRSTSITVGGGDPTSGTMHVLSEDSNSD